MSGITWLASYPKSGNTWFRVFLTNLQGNLEEPAGINCLGATPIASTRGIFDEAAGFESSDLTTEEIDRLRPEIYEHIAANAEDNLFMKVHDAYTWVDKAIPMFPDRATKGAIYFLRNPLDVAVSFAHHSGWDYDRTISNMANEKTAFCSKQKKLHNQLQQKLLSWSRHVLSWVENPGFNICILKYEDMKQNPFETFEKAVKFSGLDHGTDEIQKAIDLSSFEELQRQEKENGFKEKSSPSKLFFRKGKIGSWKEELSDKQVEQIIKDHGQVMRRFGYLDEKGQVIF
jgi:hypothetical protein